MLNRDPIQSLSCAIQQALQRDLSVVETMSPRESSDVKAAVGRRPRPDECDVVLFGQPWSGQEVGDSPSDHDRYFDLDTTVVVGPAMDACVYVASRLLYHLQHPNRRFFLDLAGHQLVSRADVYEGGDDPITEAVDMELGSMLARLHAQVLASEPNRAALVAKYLRRCAEGFEAPSSSPCHLPGMPGI